MSLNLCDDQHQEICFDGVYCPMCALSKEKDEALRELHEELDEIKSRLP